MTKVTYSRRKVARYARVVGAATAIGFCFLPPVANALPKEICEVRAVMVSSAARERDKGVSKKKVMAAILKQLGSGMKGFSLYVDTVYANPDISPEDFYKVAYASCVRE